MWLRQWGLGGDAKVLCLEYDFGEEGVNVAKQMHLDAVKGKLQKIDKGTRERRYIVDHGEEEDAKESDGEESGGKNGQGGKGKA